MLDKAHIQNFNTLCKAIRNGDVALMECQLTETGETRAVICAVNREEDGTMEFMPFSVMVWDNPYELLIPPTEAVAA